MTLTLALALAGGCGGDESRDDEDGSDAAGTGLTLTADGTAGSSEASTGDSGDDGADGGNCPPGGCLDVAGDDTGPGTGCAADGTCNQIDLLFVIDNSGTMGEEQLNLANNFPLLVDKLENLVDMNGQPIDPDVNILVTTTDMDHPSCMPSQPMGYEPAQGAPVTTACVDRIGDFTNVLGTNSVPEACTNFCSTAVVPDGPFIHFDGTGNNVVGGGGTVAEALSCIGPQGINGCGFEAPLESMMQALDPAAAWNAAAEPFLRPDAILAIVIVTDEADCSVRSPEGYAQFSAPNDQFWEVDPSSGMKEQATSAVCWNSGVDCGTPGPDGVYAACSSVDTGTLHSTTDRYLAFLKDYLIDTENKDVIMLGILGVPEVTAHNDQPPFQPTAGGVEDLVYRTWQAGDILPGDPGPDVKEYEFGIGPGCTGVGGQAIPPVRVKEVCQALNTSDEVRCCIESICDDDFSLAINCLAGIIQDVIIPG